MDKSAIRQAWQRMETVVREHRVELAGLRSSGQLHAWAVDNGCVGPRAWPMFCAELGRQLGIDYEDLRADEFDSAPPGRVPGGVVEVYAAGEARRGVFAVCDQAGRPIACGRFGDEDRLYRGDQASAETSAAEKGLWLAERARRHAGVERCTAVVHLTSAFVDGQLLKELARHWGLAVELDVVAISPASRLARAPRFIDWRGASLAGLISKGGAARA